MQGRSRGEHQLVLDDAPGPGPAHADADAGLTDCWGGGAVWQQAEAAMMGCLEAGNIDHTPDKAICAVLPPSRTLWRQS